MDKKICIITGANSGIGKAAAIQIAAEGHQVIMACRHPARGKVALQDVRQESGNDAVELMIVDMSLQASIKAFVAKFLAKYGVLLKSKISADFADDADCHSVRNLSVKSVSSADKLFTHPVFHTQSDAPSQK